jgi:thymidylate synthase (FAD)
MHERGTYEKISILDHGYLQLIESWGSDERIIEAARMSTGKGFLGWGPTCDVKLDDKFCGEPVTMKDIYGGYQCLKHGTVGAKPGDEKLLKYLWDNKHATPFEMAGMTIEVQAPIFVFREWHRHRTASYNEMSARYTPLPDVNYVPTVERLMVNSKTNKQAGTIKGAEELTEANAVAFQRALVDLYASAQRTYEWALGSGVPKELARVHLPVGRYSRMRASANLRNWLAFLTLRMAPAAQYEIRQYANALAEWIKLAFPRTYQLFISE